MYQCSAAGPVKAPFEAAIGGCFPHLARRDDDAEVGGPMTADSIEEKPVTPYVDYGNDVDASQP
jgi:hypothetical protein